MKKFLIFLTICLLSINVKALNNAYVVINADTGYILEKSAEYEENYPASLTKLMVLYITFDALDKGVLKENQKLLVSKRAASMPETKLGLKEGQYITVSEAIKSLVIKSANDAAVVLSENIGSSEDVFSSIMTNAAVQIGLKHTEFKNASGLTGEGQFCTAYDMAMLSYAIYKHFPQYFKYFSLKEFKFNGKTFVNHNNLLNTYVGCNGMKTGFTNKSGYNLVASATREGKTIIAVSLGNKTAGKRNTAVKKLLDKGFKKLGVKGKNYEKTESDFKVQLGAFYNKNDAISVIEDGYDFVIVEVRGEKGILYKPQLINLSYEQAEGICETLDDCLIVRE